jgi:catechol 2,3-dioxygenase
VTIDIDRVGHVVLKVTDLERARHFYEDILGLREVARCDVGFGTMAFLSTGRSHHDLGLVEVGPSARRPEANETGLFHLALRIGDDLDALRDAKQILESHGITPEWVADHRVSQSIYVADPDGNTVELYVDADPAIWHADPSSVACAEPLTL